MDATGRRYDNQERPARPLSGLLGRQGRRRVAHAVSRGVPGPAVEILIEQHKLANPPSDV